jgi:hypothetical protein
MSYETYPPNISASSDEPLYFIEFHDWQDGSDIIWKLYKRQFLYSKEEFENMISKAPSEYSLLCREGHPWSLLEDKLLDEGCVPNKKWLCWMVDALNEKVYSDDVISINCSGGV